METTVTGATLTRTCSFTVFQQRKNDQNTENRMRMLRITNMLDVESDQSLEVNG